MAKPYTTGQYKYKGRNGKSELLHRITAEAALGRPLPPKAVVHHTDGTRSEKSTLVICENQSYHVLLHLRMRIKAAGGNPNTDAICCVCKRPKPRAEFGKRRRSRFGITETCTSCQRRGDKERYWVKKAATA